MSATDAGGPAVHRPRPSALVVGGGVGGLVAAVLLAARGCRVRLFERQARVGGKIRRQRVLGRDLDVGPTVLTMRWAFEEIFDLAGCRLEDHLELRRCPVLARHFWDDGSCLDLHADFESSRAAVEAFAGAEEADGFERFQRHCQVVLEYAERMFIRASSPGLGQMIRASGRAGPAVVFKLDLLRKMSTALRRFFRDERLIQLFARYATYYGSSPFRAPATLNLIAEVERQGVWLPAGGMAELPHVLARIADDLGVEIACGQGVHDFVVENGRVLGVVLENGALEKADAVVFNGDRDALAAGAMGTAVRRAVRRAPVRTRSLSAITVAAVAQTTGVTLLPHNVFFRRGSYGDEFDAIFKAGRLPARPTVYVRAQDRDRAAAVDGPERLFCIMNAPPTGDTTRFDREVASCRAAARELFAACGLDVDLSDANSEVATPNHYAELFPHTGGALYGGVTHSIWAPLRRPAARSRMRGLYLAGGSVHPGAGVPMAAMSGRLAAAAVLEDVGLAPSSTSDERPT